MQPTLSFSKIPLESKDAFRKEFFSYLQALNAASENQERPAEYKYFDRYWEDPGRIPCYILYRDQRAGFFLVWQTEPLGASILTEFCIFPEYRKKGIGRMAALKLFSEFGTSWEVNSRIDNPGATFFWEKVIAAHTGNAYQKTPINNEYYDGYHFEFVKSRKPVDDA